MPPPPSNNSGTACGVALIFLFLILVAVIMAWSRCSRCARAPTPAGEPEEGGMGIQLVEQFKQGTAAILKPFGQMYSARRGAARHAYVK